ncbi:8673_t:CDS:2, partial [Cetraspora pellucida]
AKTEKPSAFLSLEKVANEVQTLQKELAEQSAYGEGKRAWEVINSFLKSHPETAKNLLFLAHVKDEAEKNREGFFISTECELDNAISLYQVETNVLIDELHRLDEKLGKVIREGTAENKLRLEKIPKMRKLEKKEQISRDQILSDQIDAGTKTMQEIEDFGYGWQDKFCKKGKEQVDSQKAFFLGKVDKEFALQEAVSYGANALMIYLGAPQNSWRNPLSKLKIPEFRAALRANNIDINNVVVHAPYLLNLANTINKEVFDFSVAFLKKEMARMAEIGLKTLVLHPGNALNARPEEALSSLVQGINLVLDESSGIRIALETMSRRKGEIGGTFVQLQTIIAQVNQPEKIGVC